VTAGVARESSHHVRDGCGKTVLFHSLCTCTNGAHRQGRVLLRAGISAASEAEMERLRGKAMRSCRKPATALNPRTP
jgi:ABC-type dipeptide/oligopeptide/nickel transport system ATPase component